MRDAAADKEAMRVLMRDRLRAIPPEARVSRSIAACDRLAESPLFAEADTVLAYLVMRDWLDPRRAPELCCDRLIELAHASGKWVCAPRLDWAARTMAPAVIAPGEAGEVRFYNVPEPRADAERLAPEAIDLVLTPGVAFDRAGRRLGRGGGFYDRFFERLAGSPRPKPALAVGLAFDEQLVDAVPAGPLDRPVDAIATDTQLIRV